MGAFFLLPLLLLTTPRRVTIFAHCVFWPLLFVAVQTLLRHAGYGFSFADQFHTMHPFMRNHVSYAGCLATFTPWLGYLIVQRRRAGRSYKWLLYGIGALWLLAIGLAFTRAAYVALVGAAAAFYVIRQRLLRPALVLVLVAGVATAVYFTYDDKYLDYAPDYDTTISHQQFNDLLSATYQLEDISTMERFYRWVAGGNMIPYRPLTGFGPGNFVEHYQAYTNNNFVTYVSDNLERSGIHNYYLMTLVEQAIRAYSFYCSLWPACSCTVSSSTTGSRTRRRGAAIMAGLLSVLIVAAFCIINDVLETDKIGTLFFLSIAIIITMGTYRSGQLPSSPPASTGPSIG